MSVVKRFVRWFGCASNGGHWKKCGCDQRTSVWNSEFKNNMKAIRSALESSARKLALQDTSRHRMTSGRYRCPQSFENMTSLGLKGSGVREWVSTFLLCCPILKVFEAQKGADICNGFLWLRTSQTRMPRSIALGQIRKKLREAKMIKTKCQRLKFV